MVALAWISGIIAALCMVMGIVTAIEVVLPLTTELTWLFWFALSGILFLASILFTLGRGEYE
jgi:hypothetical protein